MKYIKLAGIIIIAAIVFNACCKSAPCKGFTADELAWIPYKDGDVFYLKSDLTGRIYTLRVGYLEQHKYENNTCTEGQNYCENSIGTTINSSNDSLGLTCVLKNENNYNDSKKKSYKVWFIIGSTRVFESNGTNNNLQTKVINGVTYTNVIVYPDGLNNLIYYAKGLGIVGYHLTKTNEWLYKQ